MAELHSRAIVWLRRDLRLSDNVALALAAKQSQELCLAFVLDPLLLGGDRVGAPIVQTFFEALASLRRNLRERESELALLEGEFAEELIALARRIDAKAVFYNEDYEPAAIARDARVSAELRNAGLFVHASLDHVYFSAEEIRNASREAYKVFTPYSRCWRQRYFEKPNPPVFSSELLRNKLAGRDLIGATRSVPTPEEYRFTSSAAFPKCSEPHASSLLDAFLAPDGAGERYEDDRNFPSVDGTSHLSPQLRAGTIGIRTCFTRAFEAAERSGAAQIEKWIGELIWREFYQMILKSYPHVDGAPFLHAAARIPWVNDEERFTRWTRAETGYPIVDAAMRQLNQRGWMHNRLRMIVASFLTKHLLIDWRWGERYFEQHLADADLAQNNGGWQWAASTGTDAAPYFRIFNPVTQSKTFDPDGAFIRLMVPELASVPLSYVHAPWEMPPLLQAQVSCRIGIDYPEPIIDHATARNRALAVYEPILGKRRSR